MSNIPKPPPRPYDKLTNFGLPRPACAQRPTDGKKLEREELVGILRRCLNKQHQEDPNVMAFIVNYLFCRDKKEAARLSGISMRDASMLLARNDIYETIRQVTEQAVLKYGYDAEEVIERVKEILFVDPLEFQNDDGTYKKSLKDIPPDIRRAIKKFKAKNLFEYDHNGIKHVVGELIEVEFWDKLKAAELLGREKEIFKPTTKVTHDLTVNMSNILLESNKRGDAAVTMMKEAIRIDTHNGGSDE